MRKLIYLFSLLLSTNIYALDLIGRAGLGYSNQFVGGLDALSFKIQKSQNTAYGAMVAVNSGDETDYGLGLKLYRYIFDEPQLNFYASGLLGMLRVDEESGFQVDGTLGAEAHIPGIESLGISFEFGLSFYKLSGSTNLETVGYNFFSAAVHFYL